MMNKNLLYIGLNGYAGSGKDTVAKALRLMLSYDWKTLEEFKIVWEKEAFKNSYATLSGYSNQESASSIIPSAEDSVCMCIAFADQLKKICASMFGLPIEYFYYKKETSWICINGDFEYTEKKPLDEDIITAEDYYTQVNSFYDRTVEKKWMSLREVLVYVGTYICQRVINKDIFVNGVENTIKKVASRSKTLKYVICTDVRFDHEMDFIKKHHGININISRNSIQQMDNIAEHGFDDDDLECMFDFIIDNNKTYDDLLETLWDLVHNHPIFNNETVQLQSHDGTNNYLRLIDEIDIDAYHSNSFTTRIYQCCFPNNVVRVVHDFGKIVSIDPSGGPMLSIGNKITNVYGDDLGTVTSILNDDMSGFIVSVKL